MRGRRHAADRLDVPHPVPHHGGRHHEHCRQRCRGPTHPGLESGGLGARVHAAILLPRTGAVLSQVAAFAVSVIPPEGGRLLVSVVVAPDGDRLSVLFTVVASEGGRLSLIRPHPSQHAAVRNWAV